MTEITTGEANRRCYEEQTEQKESSCFLCGYQKDCWKAKEGEQGDEL